ncbi:hypothetical protein PV328_010373 [Microctonus aethiopoides]|uniref:Uncharacterized protein n=1 Tax=Microctonus aethiopoides TaxID=144406 RepID=A0AA39FHW3_9HYME|nr:hypothetical protein PV328_010373 [Microctonus aethiopoides]
MHSHTVLYTYQPRRRKPRNDDQTNVLVHRSTSQSSMSLDLPGSSDCIYSRLYPEVINKSFEHSIPYPDTSRPIELTKPNMETLKFSNLQNRTYESIPKYELSTRTYLDSKCYNIQNSKEYGSKYPEVQTRTYDSLPKYLDTKNYTGNFKYPETTSSAKSYTCVHSQYYPTPEAYSTHESDVQNQGMSTHTFYPYISASMAQSSYCMGPR